MFSPCLVGRTGRGGIGGGGGLAGFVFAGLAGALGFPLPTTSVQSLSGLPWGFGVLSLFQALWTMMVRASILSPVLVIVAAREFRSLVISLCSLVTVLRRWLFSFFRSLEGLVCCSKNARRSFLVIGVLSSSLGRRVGCVVRGGRSTSSP